jgi:hypothetical protein
VKPKEIVKANLEQVIVPELDACGFRYSPSQLKFTRKRSYVTQTISVSLNRYNSSLSIDFWTMWAAGSSEYARWYKDKWGIDPENNALGGCPDWDIPGWSYQKPGYHFDLSEPSQRNQVMKALLENISRYGLPYLDSLSTWEGAAEGLLSEGWMFGKAADFFLIAGADERARQAIERGIELFEEGKSIDSLNELPQLKQRLEKYFGVKPRGV